MKTILVINDDSFEAEHASKFALVIAQKVQADILLANRQSETRKIIEKVVAGNAQKNTGIEKGPHILHEHLSLLNDLSVGYLPSIKEVDITDLNETDLAEVINRNQIWLVVKGMTDILPEELQKKQVNIDAVLKRVLCPVLLIPYAWSIRNIERLVYIADLRYCRMHIVKYLVEFAKLWQADLSIAHLSAKGLPNMEESYAQGIFSQEICNNVDYDRMFFNNIKERNMATAVDVMINGMQNDILALINHRFHFEEIIGNYITERLPSAITIPLLIFPS